MVLEPISLQNSTELLAHSASAFVSFEPSSSDWLNPGQLEKKRLETEIAEESSRAFLSVQVVLCTRKSSREQITIIV